MFQMKATKDIRLTNITKLARVITGGAPMTRRELAQNVDLSLMTVTTLVDQLLEMGIITLLPVKNDSKNGRKADLLSPNINDRRILILDLSDYNFLCDTVDLCLNTRGPVLRHQYRREQSYAENLTEFLGQVKASFSAAPAPYQLLGISAVVPGPFFPQSGSVMNKRIPELCSLDLKSILQKSFPGQIVYIEEDVKFAAYSLLGDSRGLEEKIVSYIYMGEGVGGGIINNLQIVLGRNSVAGDVGQLMANKTQNYEQMLSIRRLYRELCGQETDAGAADILDSLAALQRREPAKVAACLENVYGDLANLLYNVIWLLNPHLIVIDCAYLLRLAPDSEAKVEAALRNVLKQNESYLPEIRFLQSGRNGIYCGGGLKVLELYIKNQLYSDAKTGEEDPNEKKKTQISNP